MLFIPYSGDLRFEIGCATTSLLLLVVYHVRLYCCSRRNFNALIYLNEKIKKEWTYQQQGKGAIPINTLRDFERAAASRANMALLFMTGVLGFAGTFSSCILQTLNIDTSSSAGVGAEYEEEEAYSCTPGEQFLLAKLLLIAVVMYSTFNSYNQEIRFLGHAQMCINIRTIGAPGSRTPFPPSITWYYMRRMQRYRHRGMRGFHLILPLVGWVFGPTMLLVATLCALWFCYNTDYERDLLGGLCGLCGSGDGGGRHAMGADELALLTGLDGYEYEAAQQAEKGGGSSSTSSSTTTSSSRGGRRAQSERARVARAAANLRAQAEAQLRGEVAFEVAEGLARARIRRELELEAARELAAAAEAAAAGPAGGSAQSAAAAEAAEAVEPDVAVDVGRVAACKSALEIFHDHTKVSL